MKAQIGVLWTAKIGDSEITQFLQSLRVEKKNVMFLEQGATRAARTLVTTENCQLSGAIFALQNQNYRM